MRATIRVEMNDKEVRDAIMEAAKKVASIANAGSGSVHIEDDAQGVVAVVEFQYQRAKQ